MTTLTKYGEYLLCKQRGHTASSSVIATSPPQSKCVHCGTVYHFEYVLVEAEYSVPKRAEYEKPMTCDLCGHDLNGFRSLNTNGQHMCRYCDPEAVTADEIGQ